MALLIFTRADIFTNGSLVYTSEEKHKIETDKAKNYEYDCQKHFDLISRLICTLIRAKNKSNYPKSKILNNL